MGGGSQESEVRSQKSGVRRKAVDVCFHAWRRRKPIAVNSYLEIRNEKPVGANHHSPLHKPEIFIAWGVPSTMSIIVKMRPPPREPPVGGEGATGSRISHPGEVFVSGGEGAPGLLANAGNACLNVPGLVGLDK